MTGSHVLPAARVGDVSQPRRCPHHGPSAVPGDVLLARLWHIPSVPSHGVQPRCSRRSRVCSWGAPRLCLVQKVRDELRKGRQLQGKEQIPLSHLMLCICVSVGAGALARSVALFSLPVAVPVTAVLWGSCGLVFCTSSSNKCHVDPETEVPGQLPGVWVPCPHSQAGEKPETRQALEQVSLDGHLWAWMGTFAKPSFGGRGCRWVCSGSRLDLGCHLIAGASPGWVGAQGQGHHGGCGQRLLLVTDWDGKTPASPGAVGCGLSPALASQPLLILPLMRMGFCKLKVLP